MAREGGVVASSSGSSSELSPAGDDARHAHTVVWGQIGLAPGFVLQVNPAVTMSRWQRAWRIWERSLRGSTSQHSHQLILWGELQRCGLRLLYWSFDTYNMVSARREYSQLWGVPCNGNALLAYLLEFGDEAQHQGIPDPGPIVGLHAAEALPFRAQSRMAPSVRIRRLTQLVPELYLHGGVAQRHVITNAWGFRQQAFLRLLGRAVEARISVSVRRECSQLLGVPGSLNALRLHRLMLEIEDERQLQGSHDAGLYYRPLRETAPLPEEALHRILVFLADGWWDVVVSIHAPPERLRLRRNLLPRFLPTLGEEGPVTMVPHWRSPLAWQSRPSSYTCLLMWGAFDADSFQPPDTHWAQAARILAAQQPQVRILSGLSSSRTLPPQALLAPGRPYLHSTGDSLNLGHARMLMHTALDSCWSLLSRARHRWAYYCAAALPDLRMTETVTLAVREDLWGRSAHELVRQLDLALPHLQVYHNRIGTLIYMFVDREDHCARRTLAACSLGHLLAVLQQRAAPDYSVGPRPNFSHHGSRNIALEGRLRIWAVDTRADINMLVRAER